MKEFMYDVNAGLIAVVLLVSTVAVLEIGYRIGFRLSERADEPARTHVNATQSSTLSLLALLLAFTFSQSLQRFDTRSDHVVDEANAIGTAYLRIDLLPPVMRDAVRSRMREYLDLRIHASTFATSEDEEWRAATAAGVRVQGEIWSYAQRAAEIDPNPVTSGLFIQAVNEMIDSFGRRYAGLDRHVPEAVLILLYGVFLITGGIVGFAAGVNGHRPPTVTLVMVALIVVLIFVIIDLDRPRRGLTPVSKKSLYDLQASIEPGPAASIGPTVPGIVLPAASGASR